MNLVLLGAPGAGKGTVAQELVAEFGVAHISTGDLLRAAVKGGTELGIQAKKYMDAGELVPDQLVIDLVKERLAADDAQQGFILDGFPRNTAQAVTLDSELSAMGREIDCALLVDVAPEVIIDRLSSRRTCRACGYTGTAADATCPKCGGEMYQTIISKYSAKERDGMAEMLAEVVMGMEQNPDQDFLGSLYMMCELGNDHAGQFFTPYDVCRCMAEITFDPKLHPDMEGFISVSDPACGAGATLLAFLNVCKRRNICYHNKVLVIAQDIDFIVGLMCYIQCSFMGCAGYVVIGDTLVNPATAYDSRGLLPAGPQNRIWYMPLFSTDVWYMRRQIAQMNLLFEPKGEPAKIEKTDIKPANLQKSIKNEPKAPENEPLNETKTGQLTFF